MVRLGSSARARATFVLAAVAIAALVAIPANAAAFSATIADGGDGYLNAAEIATVTVNGTYDAADPAIAGIRVAILDSTCTSVESVVMNAALNAGAETFTAGPFDLTPDLQWPQGNAICAQAWTVDALDAPITTIAGSNTPLKDTLAPAGTVVIHDADGYLNAEEANRPPASAIKVDWESAALDIATTTVAWEDALGNSPDPACGPTSVAGTGNGYLDSVCALALPDGQIFFRATWEDMVGNQLTASASLIKLGTAPGAVIITAPASGSVFPPGTDVNVTGTGPANSKIRVVDFNDPFFTTSDADGNWSYLFVSPLEGSHAISARAVDAAGNDGPKAQIIFTIDRLLPVITLPMQNALVPGIFTVAGTGKPGSTIELFEGSVSSGKTQVTSSGNWTATVGLSDGTHTLKARGVDVGGRVSPFSAPRSFLVDAGRPTVAVTTASGSRFTPTLPGPLATPDVKIDGTAADTGPASVLGVLKVELTYLNGLTGAVVLRQNATCAACGLGAASVTWTHSPSLPSGFYTVIASSLDTAGNRSFEAAITFQRV